MAFWDSSAVVPLCLHQPQTSRLRRLLRDHLPLVVWWGTPVEAISAFHRLRREGSMTASGFQQASDRLAMLRRSWAEVNPTEKVRNLAEVLLGRHSLRAADAVQLAAALVWCGERPARRVFVCLDRRLAQAAKEAGFATPAMPLS